MKQGVISFDRIDPAQFVIDFLPAIMVPELILQLFSRQEPADLDGQISVAIMLVFQVHRHFSNGDKNAWIFPTSSKLT